MNKEERIEQEIAKTLACLYKIENIEVDPFFYNRLQARMEYLAEPPGGQWFRRLFSSQMVRTAFLILLIIINFVSAGLAFQNNRSPLDTRQVQLSTVVEEYSLYSLNRNDYLYGVWE